MFEDGMLISEGSRRSLKSSEEVRSLPKTSEVCPRRSPQGPMLVDNISAIQVVLKSESFSLT